jgi:hypothetical protein
MGGCVENGVDLGSVILTTKLSQKKTSNWEKIFKSILKKVLS